MKARLVSNHDSIYLLNCNGESNRLSFHTAREFLLNFTDKKYYDAEDADAYNQTFMTDAPGVTIAEVDDSGCLLIRDVKRFKEIIVKSETEFLGVQEFAELHGKSIAMVRRMCQNNRIPGAVRVSNAYMIPADASYPVEKG